MPFGTGAIRNGGKPRPSKNSGANGEYCCVRVLALWYQVGTKRFDHLVLNIGREVGMGLEDVAHYISTDSTYGTLSKFLHGFKGEYCIDQPEKREQAIEMKS